MLIGARLPVYRVQDATGRGPWRPGFSHTWIDGDAPADRLTETVFDLLPIAELRALPVGFAYGCACRTLGALFAWFTPIEWRRLQSVGFHPVRLHADLVVAESPWQVLIGRRRPLADGATRLRWPR